MARAKTKSQIKKIKKRDGRMVAFEVKKIERAIWLAAKAAGGEDRCWARYLAGLVVKELEKRFNQTIIPEVEQVQDIVERILLKRGHEKTYKAYTLYRDLHSKMRDISSLVDSDELIQKYLDKESWLVKENANMTYSLQGLNNHVASIISSNFWLNKIYTREIRKAHLYGDIHIHNLVLLSPYCTGWDLKDFLTRGFGGVPGKVNSAPPKHFSTALGQLVNFFYTLQGEVAGAVAVADFDTYFAPFIRYDKLTYKEVKQEIQEFIYNMNVPTRVGFQTPFTNCTIDLVPPKTVGEEVVIIGGKPVKAQYKQFQKEMDMFNKAFAEVMSEGDAHGRVFTFPIPTYSVTKDFDWENPVLEPIFEMTRKYGIPYWANYVNSDMRPEDARSMCPIAGDEKVLIRSSRGRGLEFSEIRQIYEGNSSKEKYEIFSDGRFVKGKFNKFNNQKMIKVILANSHEIKESLEHLNLVMSSGNAKKLQILKGKYLKKGMYLPYSLKAFSGSGGTRDLGFFVGAFAGDGSFDGETTVIFSLEDENKKFAIEKLTKIARDYFGATIATKTYKNTKLYTLKIHSKAAVGLCKDFVTGKERDKHYTARLFGTSIEFRKGVIEGHYATDGGNRNRIYTSSRKMLEGLNMLTATLGTTTSIYKDKRNGRLGTEPNYAVLIYQLNRKRYGKFWFKRNQKLWVKIKTIEEISNNTAYCFEVENDKPLFTVGTSGLLTHNCRLRLDNRVLRKRGGLFAANPLTGAIGVVTINLPRIGFLAESKKDFFNRLNKLLRICKESLLIKRKTVEEFTEKGLYPYCRYYLSDVKKRTGEYWSNHFNTIGIIGMNEALENFLGKGIANQEAKVFALEVMDFMRKRILQYQKFTGQLFNLEATPAEGTSYHFAKIDKERYPRIIVANQKDTERKKAAPFYTNSTFLPVDYTNDIFEALDHQDELQTKYNGGTVLHGFLGEMLPDIRSVKKLIKKIAENYQLPYFTLTPTFSICPKHGYLAGEHKYCPKCDEEIGYKRI
ncbi:MAG TPA: anaerobic ribonucleoside-triphosphate reductase [Candidatus Bathyarchaeia archaeon]|nr:anaerobic ribonucleoside-triphosphate reductase [Candidatus Bathyarchaeia archaeon]